MSMDKILKSDEKPYISPIINIRQFLTESFLQLDRQKRFFDATPSTSADHSERTSSADPRRKFTKFMLDRGFTNEDASKAIGSGDGALAKMFQSCPIGEYEITFPPKDSDLMTHKVLHNIRESHETSAVKNALVGRGKYFRYREQELRRYYVESGCQAENDVVMTVHLLKPLNRTPEITYLKNRCEVKLMVRGDMPLVRLREKIFCPSDFWSNLEDFEVLSADDCFTNRFTSSFFFIHDTFYIDRRHPTSNDITQPIREFLERKPKQFGPNKVEDMANVRVVDLNLRLGQPYVYQHQGRCEHVLIFSDIRLLLPGDVQNLADYPIRLYDSIQQKMCGVCSDAVASFVVTESDRLPMTPAFFCRKCFRAFHYDGEQRIGQFRAFHYMVHAGTE
uniref:snRNA-activating protein complex subunit 3 n=1 Tax=Globodera rostochiensis TaxID=31243 RepID=A0A914HUV6_GLORO